MKKFMSLVIGAIIPASLVLVVPGQVAAEPYPWEGVTVTMLPDSTYYGYICYVDYSQSGFYEDDPDPAVEFTLYEEPGCGGDMVTWGLVESTVPIERIRFYFEILLQAMRDDLLVGVNSYEPGGWLRYVEQIRIISPSYSPYPEEAPPDGPIAVWP